MTIPLPDERKMTTVGLYLIQRLKEIGIDTIFGVPGDYNLLFLDLIEEDKDLTWAANVNELNAAYAADGYARVKGSGAVLTTFGVGELSAANGIAGSYAEKIPVIHVVGAPRTTLAQRRAMMHHTLGDGDYSVFYKIYSRITTASAILTGSSAGNDIDRVISESMKNQSPGYLAIPADIVNVRIPMPSGALDYALPKNPYQTQSEIVQAIVHAIDQAKHPIIVIDGGVRRTGIIHHVAAFVEMTGFPTYAAPMGIDAIDHALPNYRGCYQGSFTIAGIRAEFKHADLILQIGAIPYDTNTGGFSTNELDPAKIIAFHTTKTQVFDRCFEKIAMQELIPIVTRELRTMAKSFGLGPPIKRTPHSKPGSTLSQSYFWETFPSFLPPRAMVIAETGTVSLGSFNLTPLPKDGRLISQVAWGSVGWALPATFGACLADRSRRCFLLVGDGAFQLSAQELSPMLCRGVCPIVVLFNNNGYLIEKLIHPTDATYNDVQAWKYKDSLTYFGGKGAQIGVQRTVRTPQAYTQAMQEALAQPNRIHFIDAVFPENDTVQDVINVAVACGQNTA